MEKRLLESIQSVKKPMKPLVEQVVDQIRTLIIEQHLSIGSKLPTEMELAQQLNVGRGTVREAVKQLVARNVLEIQRGRGTFIANNTGVIDDPFGFTFMDDEDRMVRELYDIRLQMEPWVASLAAQYATEENIAELRTLQVEVEQLLLSHQNYLPADQKFHVCIANCTQNRVLPMLIPVVTYSIHLFGKLNSVKLGEDTINTHRKIVEAIVAHDPTAAQQAMTEHLLLNKITVPALL